MSFKTPKQDRSRQTWTKITNVAITLLAEEGISALTHRRLAKDARVSLTSIVYYFPRKTDVLAAVSQVIFQGYQAQFARACERYEAGQNRPNDLWEFSLGALRSNLGANRSRSIAWVEILLDSTRRIESRMLAEEWFDGIRTAWRPIADIVEPDLGVRDLQSQIDLNMGLLVISLGLGIDCRQLDEMLVYEPDMVSAWNIPEIPPSAKDEGDGDGYSPKAQQTRARILGAAIAIINEEGASAISYSRVAKKANLTTAVASHYYKSILVLLEEAQVELFAASKDRYREVTAQTYGYALSLEKLTDVTAFILQREIMMFTPENLAQYQLWIEATRKRELEPTVWSSVLDQTIAWQRAFSDLVGEPKVALGILAQGFFVGKLMRIVSTGSNFAALLDVRSEIKGELNSLAADYFFGGKPS